MSRLPSSRARAAWRDSLQSVALAILVALSLRAFVFEAFKIPSGSMIPSLQIGDQIWVNKLIFGPRIPFTTVRLIAGATPQHGDVIVFVCPEPPNEDYIKRVIGLPGDKVQLIDNVVYLNDQPLPRRPLGAGSFANRDTDGWLKVSAAQFEERLGAHTYTVLQEQGATAGRHGTMPPFKVPADHLFVMGDNRDHSHDSRVWGAVPMRHVIGRSTFIWWSWGEHGLDVRRLGHWVP